jgi:hypothetical protein
MNHDLRAMMERYEKELFELRQQAVPVMTQPQEPTPSPAPFFATAPLQIRVTAANEAIPIPNALVVISRENGTERTVVKTVLTGNSGTTEPLLLPATDPALTLKPETDIPLVTYEIQVSAPGYYRIRSSGIPLYGGVPSVVPLTMIPLPEFKEPEAELDYEVPRNNL